LEILIRDLARDHIPHRYEKKSGWGDQVERWDGLHVQLKGLRLLTKRRKKMVNHGTWKKYSAELVDPDRDFQFRLNSLRKNANGKWIVHFSVRAELRLFGRLSEWIKGVQLISVSVDAQANVTLDVMALVGSRLDFSKVPPDLFLEPRVSQAKLTVNRFRVDRVSKAGGEIAQQVGRGVRAILDDKIGRYQEKLVEKMNLSLERKRDDLKLSLSELVDSSWSDLLGGLKQDVSPEDR
jgi:hypothetical protein